MKIKSIVIGAVLAMNLAYASNTVEPSSGTRLAVVDMHSVLETYPKMEAMRKTLEQKFSKEHDSIAAAKTKLEQQAKKVERDSSVMSKEDLAKAKQDLQKQQQALQERSIKFQQSAYAAQDEAMKKVIDEVTAIVTSVAKENKFSLVLPKGGTIYSQEASDITEKVKSRLNS